MKACISHDYMFEMCTINVIEAATSTLLFKKNYNLYFNLHLSLVAFYLLSLPSAIETVIIKKEKETVTCQTNSKTKFWP